MPPLTDADCLRWRAKAIGIARSLGAPAQEWEDLAQDALLRLLQARRRYDPSKGAAWPTFALWHVRGAIQDTMRRHATHFEPLTVDEPVRDLPSEDVTIAALLPSTAVDLDLSLDVRLSLASLPPRERLAILAPVAGYGSRDVATVFRVSVSRVQQLRARGLKRMRSAVA